MLHCRSLCICTALSYALQRPLIRISMTILNFRSALWRDTYSNLHMVAKATLTSSTLYKNTSIVRAPSIRHCTTTKISFYGIVKKHTRATPASVINPTSSQQNPDQSIHTILQSTSSPSISMPPAWPAFTCRDPGTCTRVSSPHPHPRERHSRTSNG